ncbi:MAG: hypothetical protein R3E68_21595 [Burkholderiaceae bacterium]
MWLTSNRPAFVAGVQVLGLEPIAPSHRHPRLAADRLALPATLMQAASSSTRSVSLLIVAHRGAGTDQVAITSALSMRFTLGQNGFAHVGRQGFRLFARVGMGQPSATSIARVRPTPCSGLSVASSVPALICSSSPWIAIIASQKRSSSAFDSDSVGSIIKVSVTGNDKGRRMKPVVHQALGDLLGRHAVGSLEFAQIEDALVYFTGRARPCTTPQSSLRAASLAM